MKCLIPCSANPKRYTVAVFAINVFLPLKINVKMNDEERENEKNNLRTKLSTFEEKGKV
jgi:hypothetical protein